MSNSQQRSPSDGGQPSKAPGAYSLAEILSQPQCWSSCLTKVRESGILEEVRDRFIDCDEYILIGCGSSYYVALCAAATMTSFGVRARALPASELLLYPDLVLAGSKRSVPLLISRSGQTSEVLQAAELLRSRSIATLAISCVEHQALEQLASVTITLPAADEKSTVMTRSFTSMLLVLQALAATLAKRPDISKLLARLPDLATPAFADLPEKVRAFVAQHRFADYVCLGQGPFFGLACEYALKVTEMSVSYAQVFHTLEFRHGPKSIVAPEVLLVFILSEQGQQAECDMLEEMKSLGGTILVVANHADKRVRAAADLLIDLAIDAPEITTLAPMLVTGQLLGLYSGLKKNLDPDSPRNLSRAVILNKPSTTPEHAAL
ncbi:MAG: SIS domain-containing protein [Acidobacteriaceae bacterium]|nr:SIS domain-containing protein [Acidobacteriaceae bacterium]